MVLVNEMVSWLEIFRHLQYFKNGCLNQSYRVWTVFLIVTMILYPIQHRYIFLIFKKVDFQKAIIKSAWGRKTTCQKTFLVKIPSKSKLLCIWNFRSFIIPILQYLVNVLSFELLEVWIHTQDTVHLKKRNINIHATSIHFFLSFSNLCNYSHISFDIILLRIT